MDIKKYLNENYDLAEIQDIANGALIGGVSGFIYYSETIAFYERHEAEIWQILEEDAHNMGISISKILDGFSNPIEDLTGFKNSLCWYAVERSAQEIQETFWERTA